jgi:hypothetical protein
LDVTSDPSKRNGAHPNTGYRTTVTPRANADNAQTRGGHRHAAALSTLNPSIAFESRSKRGVGKATLDFATLANAWHVEGDEGTHEGSGIVCDITRLFDIPGRSEQMHFVPDSAQGGTFILSHDFSFGSVSGGGSYAQELDGEGGTLVTNGTGAGMVKGAGRSFYPLDFRSALTPAVSCGG